MQLPQTPTELTENLIRWAHTNINNNLNFVPQDKLDWQPAPNSKSVLEIINHAATTVHTFTGLIKGDPKTELTPATNREQAQALVTQVVQAHLALLHSLTPDEMQQIIKTPIGELPKGVAVGTPVIELINHHGQITYIQSLLGDSSDHLIFE